MDAEWAFASIGDLARARGERVMPATDSDRPYVGLEHIEAQTGRLVGVGRAGDTVSLKTPFEVGDILYGKLRPALRKVLRAPICGVASTEILAIVARRPTDAAFLEHVLHSDQVLAWALQGAEGTKMPRTSWERLSRHTFLCPPAEERVAIGQTLDAIDEAIEKTEAIITATEDLRKALLQELLTRGVPGWHTAWKTVPGTGTVPACWEVVQLEQLGHSGTPAVLTGPFGSALPASDFAAEGVPIFNIGNLTEHGLRTEKLQYVRSDVAARLGKYQVAPGDLLFSRVASVGRAGIVTPEFAGSLITYNLMRCRVDPKRLEPELGMYLVQGSEAVRNQIADSTGNAGRAVINTSAMSKLHLPLPGRAEQARILSLLRAVDERRLREEAGTSALVRLKSIVAEALLSGRVAVPVDTEARHG